MKFEDKRSVKDINIRIGDLIVCDEKNYIIVKDYFGGEFPFKLVNLSSFKVDEYCTNVEGALKRISELEKVTQIVPRETLKIVAE